MDQPEPDRATVVDALRDVYDPCCADRGINIVDMGVLEDVRVQHGGRVEVDIVLTSGWCPFVTTMSEAIPARLSSVAGVRDVDVQVVWDPVWTTDRLSPGAKDKLTLPREELIPYREQRLAQQRGA
jgi:metal-sulfur cluster biosynthetic enzyme